MKPETLKRIVIEGVQPEVDGGRFRAKRTLGERVVVEADIFCDGHDRPSAAVQYRVKGARKWTEVRMESMINDRWRAAFRVHELGVYEFAVRGWVDHFKTWHLDLQKRLTAGQDVSVEMLIGAQLIEEAAERAPDRDKERMTAWVELLRDTKSSIGEKIALVNDEALVATATAYPDPRFVEQYPHTLEVQVDPVRARFSTWYEMFARSAASEHDRHGTFKDVEGQLPRLAEMGFDVLYFPPIHPIGTTNRKGANNMLGAGPEDVGSPWAIGNAEGGHKAIHPRLGTLEDFQRLVRRARDDHGIDVALDIAFQCSPDHPYVKQHPEWFRHRPDGTVQFAENPPKKYEDIYPFDFEIDEWESLWDELLDVLLFWCKQGVRVLRIDNPHTKPFRLWDYLIEEVKKRHPETIFLAEAFTRPKVMYRLAKGGFTQSYTYFAWRNDKSGLTRYMEELTTSPVCDFFRPNFWPNTPDILNEYLQRGGRQAFVVRLILASTLAANYGIYGPAFELLENTPREPGSEEYLDSEKYQIRRWALNQPGNLAELISIVNQIRRENPALQTNEFLHFHPTTNEQIICYSKTDAERENEVLVAVNLDPFNVQSCWVDLDGEALGIEYDQDYQAHDLISDERYRWHGFHNYIQLSPWVMPAHIFRLRRRQRSERDFDYFL